MQHYNIDFQGLASQAPFNDFYLKTCASARRYRINLINRERRDCLCGLAAQGAPFAAITDATELSALGRKKWRSNIVFVPALGVRAVLRDSRKRDSKASCEARDASASHGEGAFFETADASIPLAAKSANKRDKHFFNSPALIIQAPLKQDASGFADFTSRLNLIIFC